METHPKYFDPQTLARLRGLRLRAQHIVEGFVSGLHRSPYRGFSIEFAEHREYAPGDDLRYLDWKVLGRTDKYYLKQFEDETNLICYLVVDVSESMAYRSADSALSKFEYAQCVASALAWLVLQQQDSSGLVTMDNAVQTVIRPAGSPAHLQQILHALDCEPNQTKSSMGPIFHELAERFQRRGIVMIISDLFDNIDSIVAGLKHLQHRRHDVVLLHTLDPAELEFPFDQPTMFRGLEHYPEILADGRAIRAAYLKEFQEFTNGLQNACRNLSIDYHRMTTDQAVDVALAPYLASRMNRLK